MEARVYSPALPYLSLTVPGGPRLGSLELSHQEFTASTKHVLDLPQRATPLQGPAAILVERDGEQAKGMSCRLAAESTPDIYSARTHSPPKAQ